MAGDRELDAHLAEHIMGLKPCRNTERGNLGGFGGPVIIHHCEDESACYLVDEMEAPFGTIGGCPKYSSDPAACAHLKEKLRELGVSYSVAHWFKWDGMTKTGMVEVQACPTLPDELFPAATEELAIASFAKALKMAGAI